MITTPSRVRVTGDRYHPVIPAGSVWVGRSGPHLKRSPYANPHRISDKPTDPDCRCGHRHTRAEAIRLYRQHLREHQLLVVQAREELRGRDLACRCRLDEECHADYLLQLVAQEVHANLGRRLDVTGEFVSADSPGGDENGPSQTTSDVT